MKIAILTIHDLNCGNRLQNYALQRVLIGMGHQVETLRRKAGFSGPFHSKMQAVKSTVGIIRHLRDRRSRFRSFDRLINFSRSIVSKGYVTPGLENEYDLFIVGSDQIWNPEFEINSELEYLPFVNVKQKVAYAASFGVSELVSNRNQIAEYLKDFQSLSVREDAGAHIVNELSGIIVDVVLDPTLLVDSEVWTRVSRKPSIRDLDNDFLLKYVLGNDAYEREMKMMADGLGLAIVDLTNRTLPVGPAEFVWLIAHAKVVCTDSFHASIFSLLFHRPFVIFERKSADADMSSRFDTLCRTFDMGHHRFCSNAFDFSLCENENWDSFEHVLARERERSLTWIQEALSKAGGCDA